MTGGPPTPVETSLLDRGTGLRNFARALRRRGWLLVVCVALVSGGVYLYTKSLPRAYTARVLLQPQAKGVPLVSATRTGLQAWWTHPEFAAAYAESGRVPAETAALLHRPGSASGLNATVDANTGWIMLSATAPDPGTAIATANVYARVLGRDLDGEATRALALAAKVTQHQLGAEHDPLQRQELSQALQGLRASQSTGHVLQVVQRATQASLTSPHPRRNTTLAVVLGLLLGAGLMVFVGRLDRLLRSTGDVPELAGAPHLVTLFDRDVSAGHADESFQTLRALLTFAPSDEPLTTFVVVSPLKREGTTTVALGLARSFARTGKRTILVDANMRRPAVASLTGATSAPGLSDLLTGHDLAAALQADQGARDGLVVVSAGAPHPQPDKLLGSPALPALLETLEREADILVIDTPPLLMVSDALPLLRCASGALAVVRLGRTPKDALRRAARVTALAGGRLLGVVAISGARGRRARAPSWAPLTRPGQWQPPTRDTRGAPDGPVTRAGNQ